MTTTYVKKLLADETYDAESPGSETFHLDMIRNINYLLDLFNGSGNSAYISPSWVSIANGAPEEDFAHGLGRIPAVVLGWVSLTTGYANSFLIGSGTGASGSACRITTVDGTNVGITNQSGATVYVLVMAW